MKKFLFLFLLLISTTVFADFSGKVVKVIDGDTVEVLTHRNTKVRIRLHGIDAPEKHQAYGNKSRLFLASLIAGKEITVKNKGKDIYNRTLGILYYQNSDINAKMVSNGYAWAYRYKNIPSNKAMVSLEKQAKKKRLGLWRDKNPIEPWKFRKANKK